jgi:hypothetical protein
MSKFGIAVSILVVCCAGSGWATAAATPKPTTVPSVAVAKPAVGVICQIAKTGDTVHIKAINKGTTKVAAGETFTFTIIGPSKKLEETITFKTDLAPGKNRTLTNAIKASRVVGCSPDKLS